MKKLSYKQKYELIKAVIGLAVLLRVFVPIVAKSICK